MRVYSILFLCISLSFGCKRNEKQYKLLGVWGPSKSENASFRIEKDSIYYPEHFKSYKYTISKDSIFIEYDGWTYKGIFYFKNDSLVLKSQDKIHKFVRITE